MDGDDNARLIYAAIAAMLLIGSLVGRRLPMKQYAKMLLAWIGIFAVAFIVMSFRPEMQMAWNRIKGEVTGAPRQTIEGGQIRLVRQDDGHFWVRANINGRETDLMVDSGASTTAINAKTANEAKLALDPVDQSVELETANGIVRARTATVKSMTIGDVQINDHDVVVAEAFGDTNVVGMNFLDKFDSWNVSGDVMLLTP
jgi:aspartyl protease family protein